jgi:hypothetical protein
MKNRYRIPNTVLTVLLASIGGLAVAQPAEAAPPPVITMQGRGSGLCVTALGTYNGAPVVQSACDYNSTAQRWARVSLGNGYELLQSVASTSTYPYAPRCLDVTDGINADGTKLQVWGCTNTPGMNWKLAYAYGSGYTTHDKVQSKLSGRCLDVPANSLVDGLQLQIWHCSSGTSNDAQVWNVPEPRYHYPTAVTP